MPFPTTIQQVRKTEAKLGRTLPPTYVGRMLEENGGVVETADDNWWLHPLFDDSDRTRLKRTCNDVVRETRSAKGWVGFPDEAISIASNGAGDRLLFLPAPSGDKFDPRVFAWDHETGDHEVVADDFAELPKRRA
jgi:hypothetical protein